MSTVIKVENLGKKYLISHQGRESYLALRDVIAGTAKKWGKKMLTPHAKEEGCGATQEEFWALKDISFEVKQGDKLGIIGGNGAGKSTILKILSRITEPSSGRVRIRGRVASLLEVGTGFHPELTGRENVFLNGAILGMAKTEIKKKFDEIVAFAEIEKFLDTPVKRYSSGMYVRLAFAVAAHLDPEILLVDEVLAVGDAAFQKKCLGKMGEVASEGRTIFFVSHNMATVQQLCTRAILLSNGRIKEDGKPNHVVDCYLSANNDSSENIELCNLKRKGGFGEKLRFIKGWLADKDGNSVSQYKVGDRVVYFIELLSTARTEEDLHVNIGVNSSRQTLITTVTNRSDYGYISFPYGKKIRIKVSLGNLMLLPGNYNTSLTIGRKGQIPLDVLESVLPFSILDTTFEQVVPHPNLPGLVHTPSSWEVTGVDD